MNPLSDKQLEKMLRRRRPAATSTARSRASSPGPSATG